MSTRGPDPEGVRVRYRSLPTMTGLAVLVLIAGLALGFGGLGPAAGPVAAGVAVAFLVLCAVGLVAPVLALRHARVAVTNPADAVAGRPVELAVTVDGVADDVRLVIPGADEPPRRVRPGTTVRSPLHSPARGRYTHVEVQLRAAGPLGLFDGARHLAAELHPPLHVAPSPLRVRWHAGTVTGEGTEVPVNGTVAGGEVTRAVRPYAPGDPARLVHWPSVARTGELVVRELDPPNPIGQAIVVDLTDLGERAETAASYAMGACLAVLGAGGRVLLCLHDGDGPVAAVVTDPHHAGRLLAVASPGPPGTPPEGWPVVEIGL